MNSFSITVGRLLCGTVRDYLDKRKFLGADIEYHESRGLIYRTFTVKGDGDGFAKAFNELMMWANSVEEQP